MYERPFVTARFTAYAGDTRRRTVSLAVRLTDDFNDQPPLGAFRLLLRQCGPREGGGAAATLEECRPRAWRGEEPVRNPSGYYCFLDAPAGSYRLLAEPAPEARFYWLRPASAGPWTAGFERLVALPRPDPRNPVLSLTLTPSPAYPFPPHATLVRGRVVRTGTPVPGALVWAQYRQTDPGDPENTRPAMASTRADAGGNYVLFFRAPDPPRQSLLLVARDDGPGMGTAPVAIREGRTTTPVDIILP